jgi:general secretion pathway protein C
MVVNWLFRRHFWVVHLVLLGIAAMIMAKIVTTVAGYWLSKKIPEVPATKVFTPSEEPILERDLSIANERNLFAAKREQLSSSEDDMEEEIDAGRWQDAKRSALSLKLVSTMVFFDPFDSRAQILDMSSGGSQNFSLRFCEPYEKRNALDIETILDAESWEPERACNDIFGMATLMRIEEFRVYILNERTKKYEYLSLLEDDITPIRPQAAPAEAKSEGINVRKTGATSYEIDQKEFDKALSNVAKLLTEARAVPELDASGNLLGFKIVYVKKSSLFEKIGLELEDVLTRINGYELNSNEKALQLFSKLRAADRFTIDIKRGGRSVTLDYSVVK